MDLGLAGAGYKGYQDNQRQIGLDALAAKKQALESAQADAGLSTLPAQMAADQSRLSLQTANNNAGLSLLPGQTANAATQQQLAQGDLSNKLTNQPTQQKIDNEQLAAAAQLSPSKAHNLVLQGKLDSNAVHTSVLGQFGMKVSAGDKAGALQFANEVAGVNGLFPGTDGKTFVDYKYNPDTKTIDMTDDKGNVAPIEAASMKQAQDMVQRSLDKDAYVGMGYTGNALNKNTGQIIQGPENVKAVVGKDGTMYQSGNHGSFEKKTDAVPGLGGSGSKASAKERMINLYMANGRNFDQAVQEVNTGVAKPKEQFILEMMSKTAIPGQSPDKLNAQKQQWSDMYDNLKSDTKKPTNAPGLSSMPASSAGAAPSIDPKYQKLFEQ